MDPHGNFIGEMCHIEAAEQGGERFNPNQTNEERRSLDNLLLMCHEHHVVTNNVGEFLVKRMQQMKRDHENRVNDFATQLQFRVLDLTKRQTPQPTVVPRKLAAALQWNLDDDELKVNAEHLNKLLEQLKAIPRPAREILVIAIERSNNIGMFGHRHFSPEEVELACGLTAGKARSLWGILDRFKIVWNMEEKDEIGIVQFGLNAPGCEWDAWGDLLTFQEKVAGALHELIVNLRFSFLD